MCKKHIRGQCGKVVNHVENHLHLYMFLFFCFSTPVYFLTQSRGHVYCNLSMLSVVYEHFISTGTNLDTDIITRSCHN